MPPPVNVLVAGATGALGRRVVDALVGRGHAVRALSRRGDDAVPTHVGDVTRPETLAGACDGIDVVVSTVGASVQPTWGWPEQTFEAVDHRGNLALLEEARAAGVRRFVYVSVHGDYPPLAYVEAHERAARAVEASGLEAVIVRPTGYFSALRALFDAARWGLGVVVAGGAAVSNPIDDADLAEVIADAVDGEPGTVDVGGPEVLTRREMSRIAFEVLGKRPILLPVPAWVLRATAALLAPLNPRLAGMLRFYAHVLTHDLVAPARGRATLRERMTSWRDAPT